MRDIRYALRTLARNRGLSIAAILVLALGIGANSAIFTVVRAVLLAPLPYQDPDRLVSLYERDVVGSNPFNVVSARNFYDWRNASASFSSMGFYAEQDADFLPSDGGLPEKLSGSICDAGFLPTLGVQAALGRTFRDEDDRPDADRVAVISSAFWRRRFSGGAAALGSRLRLDGEMYTVIGVMPADFDFPSTAVQVWLPAGRELKPDFKQQRGNHRFSVVARLKPGVSVTQAATELDGIARRIKEQNPGTLTGKGANAAPLADRMVARASNAAGAVGSSGLRAADRLRQCRQSAAGACCGRTPRGCGASRAGRRPGAYCPPVSDRKPAALAGRRRARNRLRGVRYGRSHQDGGLHSAN